jgi:hypothetical protein
MGNLNEKIQSVAAEFARSVLGMIRSMTLNELVSLTGLGGGAAKATRKARKATPAKAARKVPAGKAKAAPKRKITNTPALAAARKVQGQYLGLLRKFDGKDRNRLKKLAKSGGVPSAVAEMKKLLGRS